MPDENRPQSMGAALEQAGFGDESDTATVPDTETLTPDASSASPDDPSLSDTASTAASPTETPQSPESTPAGPIPFDRHKAILDKAYAERDALKAAQEQLAWAQQVPAGMGPKLLAMAQRVQGNPVEFLMELAAEVQADPTHAAALKSHAARILGARAAQNGNGHAPPAELPQAARSGVPEVDAVLDARDRFLAEQLAAQVADVIQQQIAPVSAITGRIQAAEVRQQREAEAQSFAQTEFAKVEKLPGFLDHREAIAAQFEAEMAQIPLADQDRLAPVVLRDVWAAIALPKLNQTTSQNVLGKLQAKAAAGSMGVRPTSGSTPQRPKSMLEALQNAGL